MKKSLLALTVLSALSTAPLAARTLMCEQCEPEETGCPEHLFVERSQLFIHAELLYWTVLENTLDYAVKIKDTTTELDHFALGDYQAARYDWRPGYRVAASYYRCPKYWEATAQYTWFYDKGSDRTVAPLNPTRQLATEPDYEKARSSIDLHYHVGDLHAARVFDPNPHLRMRLFAGLTYAYIEQSWRMRYTNFSNEFERVKEKWRFSGGGFRTGLTADWFWGCQFYLTAKMSLAALAGSYKNEEIQTINTDENLMVKAVYDEGRLAFHTQFMFGPSWQIPCDCWSFELFAGYEFNLWFNLQERIRQSLRSNTGEAMETFYSSGLFGTQGLTVRLTLGF